MAIACLPQAGLFAFPQVQPTPRLVVGIVVDQMRYDYISKYWDKFGYDGFKRLIREGYFLKNVHYNYMPTYTGPGHASIYTGCTPSVHGIIANNWYDKENDRTIYCVEDKTVKALGGSEKSGQMSPRQMLCTTLGDQLKLSDNFRSKVIGIALKDRGAILPAGHSADAAYWFDGTTGNWISSSFYMKELPAWLNEFNNLGKAKQYLENDWTTLLPIEEYTESTADDSPYEKPFAGMSKPVFPYKLKELMAENDRLNLIRSTPYGNTLTRDMAIETIRSENLGKGKSTDFICISFSSTDYVGHQFGPNAVEVEDTYLRLDKDLGELLTFLDNWVGEKNALLFLTADHGASENAELLKEHRIPEGRFNEAALLKKCRSYLAAKYGDSLALSVSNQQVFLNHKSIHALKLNTETTESDLADFLLREEGVANVYTSTTVSNWGATSDLKSKIQNGFNQKRSGDLLINYFPYWTDNNTPTGTTHGSPYDYDTHVPLIFYGNGIKQGSSEEQTDITDIAATLAYLLNIQEPSGCMGKIIGGLQGY